MVVVAERALASLWAEAAFIVVTEKPALVATVVLGAMVTVGSGRGPLLAGALLSLALTYWFVAPYEAKWAAPRRTARLWRGSLGEYGAAHDLGLRNKSDKVPRLKSRGAHDTGRIFGLRLPDGITVGDVKDRAPAIADHFGALRVEVRAEAPARCEVKTYDVDPFAGVRRSVDPQRAGLSPIIVGRCQDGSDAVVDLTDASHIALQGMTRSGKSAFCYTALSPLVEAVRAGHVTLKGLDPNRILLAPWQYVTGSTDGLALGSDPEQAATLLDSLVADLDQRLDVLDTFGLEALTSFTNECPLSVVVLEEYPATLAAAEAHDQGVKPAERTGPRIKRAVARLVSEGAKAGVRVVLIAQRMDASVVGGRERAQFGTRITFAVDNGDAVRMLHPEVDPETVEQVREFPPGRCLWWQHRVEQPMQSDLTDYPTYRRRLGAPVRTEEA